ncbi:hypothetical protein L798_02568 [Zootermopsis nevadensis]|uniref:Gustatory receptor n=1 Tax=Zootermopsis nevadensis TaxID=136037 RepID=A0A067RQP7_ZOONE|nr:hypothetical protein L798_02568 [Zootermopsis nevadensis]
MPYTNIYSATKPLYYVSSLFGLAPVSWCSGKKHGFIRDRVRILKLFWTVLLTLTLFPSMYYNISLSVPKSNNVTRIIGFAIFHVPLYLSCIITLFVGLTVNRSKLPQLLYKIMQVDRVLIITSTRLCMYRKTKVHIFLQLLVVFVIVVALWLFDMSSYCGLHCYHAYLGIVPFLVNTVEIIQFLNFVMILRTKYKLLNAYLTSLLPALKINENTVPSSNFHTTFINFVPNEVLEVKSSCSSSLLNDMTQSEVKIHHLREIYSRLYDISLIISSIYGISLLGVIVWLFTYSIACIVFALQHFSNGRIPIANILLLLLSQCLLAAIAVPCHVTTDEASRSSVLIQKLLLRRDINKRFISHLDRFYTQINSMTIKFTACGFFSLDMSLFCGIIGAICTYVFVITQLK